MMGSPISLLFLIAWIITIIVTSLNHEVNIRLEWEKGYLPSLNQIIIVVW